MLPFIGLDKVLQIWFRSILCSGFSGKALRNWTACPESARCEKSVRLFIWRFDSYRGHQSWSCVHTQLWAPSQSITQTLNVSMCVPRLGSLLEETQANTEHHSTDVQSAGGSKIRHVVKDGKLWMVGDQPAICHVSQSRHSNGIYLTL